MARTKRETKKQTDRQTAEGERPRQQQSESPQPDTAQRNIGGNQGEGNREADRRYREGATSFERSGRVSEAAEEARREVEEEEERAVFDDDRDVGDVIDFEDYDGERADGEEAAREARDRSRLS